MNVITTPYAILRHELTEQIASAPWPSPEAGFLDYFQATINPNTLSDRTLVTDRLEEAPILASSGYQYPNPRFIRPDP